MYPIYKPPYNLSLSNLRYDKDDNYDIFGNKRRKSYNPYTYIPKPKFNFSKFNINNYQKSSRSSYITSKDIYKLSRVKKWVNVSNPVFGTCRKCGHRGLVNSPCIGLY